MKLTVDQVLKKGIEAHKAGQVQEADKFYTAILQSQPKHPDANHNMGVLAVGIGKVQEALSFFKMAVEENPSIAQFWLSYIGALIKLNKSSDARVAFNQAKGNGITGEAFDQLEQSINEIDASDRDKASEEGPISAAPNIQDPPRKQSQRLMDLYGRGQHQQTLDQAADMLKQFPRSCTLYNIRGAAHVELGKFDAAISNYKKALEINPNFFEVYCNLGIAQKNSGQLDAAIKSYKQAIEIKADYEEAYFNMGNILFSKYDLDDAIDSYKKAIKINPDHIGAYFNMGNALRAKGELDAAIDIYKKVIKIKPDFTGAYNNMGSALQDKGELDVAIESYKQAINIKPDYAEGYNNMGVALQAKGELDAAIESHKQAIKIKPDYAEAYNNIANALRDRGELDAAIEHCQRALKLNPDFAEAYSNMGSALQDKGELEVAIENYKQALKINPDLSEVYNNMGNALKDKGELAAAIESYQHAIKIKPDIAAVYNNMGVALQVQGSLESAIESFKKALKINPDYTEAYYNLGVLFFELGQYKKAAEHLKLSNLSKSDDYILKTFYLQNEESNFYEKLDSLIGKGKINSIIGSLSSRAEMRYGKKLLNPFCSDPLKYVIEKSILNSCDFEEKFVRAAKEILISGKVERRYQTLLPNGYQTAGNLFLSDNNALRYMKEIIDTEIVKYRDYFNDSLEGLITNWPSDYIIYGWLVSMKSGGAISPHMHESGWLSGSIYINVPPKSKADSGNLVVCIEEPQYTTEADIGSQKIIDVNTGSLCLFPSSLLHYTIPFESTEERIVLAFDVVPK